MSQGCAISIASAVRYPDRVFQLVLYGGYALGGLKRSPADNEKREVMAALTGLGLGTDDPTFRQLFTSQLIPGGSKAQIDDFNELQRRTTSPEGAVRYFRTVGAIDVRDLLPRVTVPTLVMHVRSDRMQPIEAGRQIAAGIPGALRVLAGPKPYVSAARASRRSVVRGTRAISKLDFTVCRLAAVSAYPRRRGLRFRELSLSHADRTAAPSVCLPRPAQCASRMRATPGPEPVL